MFLSRLCGSYHCKYVQFAAVIDVIVCDRATSLLRLLQACRDFAPDHFEFTLLGGPHMLGESRFPTRDRMSTPVKREATQRCWSFEGGGQKLIPAIPDDITLLHIVPKVSWEDFYTLSSVSRAWHHVIRNRQVYDARVMSHARETFVVASFSLYGSGDSPFSRKTLLPLPSLYSRVRAYDRSQPAREEMQIRPAASLRGDPNQAEGNDMQIRPAFKRLPPIPCDGDRWICSGGYIYYFGVAENSRFHRCCNKVFVFDLAGQGSLWRACARMNERSRDFTFCAMHGKLYVFGGFSWNLGPDNHLTPEFCGSEVYDPKADSWSPIKPMPNLRFGTHRVDVVGDEFFVHGGSYFDYDEFCTARDMKKVDRKARFRFDYDAYAHGDLDDSSDDEDTHYINNYISEGNPWVRVAEFPEAYNPVTDEWRVVNPFDSKRVIGVNPLLHPEISMDAYLFAVEGKLYSIDWSSIHVYAGENSWTHLHSFSFPTSHYGQADSVIGHVRTTIVFCGQLFVQVLWLNTDTGIGASAEFRTGEFGGENKEITWEEIAQFFMRHKGYPTNSTQLIQL